MKIQTVKNGFGRHQAGEDMIVSTYPNADTAVKALLKSLRD